MIRNRRRAKIVCTLGPSSDTLTEIDALMRAGMDVVRLNFSHGDHAWHARTIEIVRKLSGLYQRPIAIIADLQGPKIRTGKVGGEVQLKAGQELMITTDEVLGNESRVSTDFSELPAAVHPGDRILLADGLIELKVLSRGRREVRCRVINGGELGSNKGINLPGIRLRLPALTAKDRRDLRFAVKHGVNYVAISFVRSAADVRAAQAAVRRLGSNVPVIAKLEKPQAIQDLESILDVADGVMVARGDLGVEMSPEVVPVVQKRVIGAARARGIPVITATQMLESMTENPRPTRAEASDVANAIYDGTDALMLSAETASGRYPAHAVRMMDRIVRHVESSLPQEFTRQTRPRANVAETVCDIVTHAADAIKLKLVAVFTYSGNAARMVSRFRPWAPIVAFSTEQDTRRKMALFWGVYPRTIGTVRDIDELADTAERRLREEGMVRDGDIVAIVSGTPLGKAGTTNFLKLHVVGAEKRRKG